MCLINMPANLADCASTVDNSVPTTLNKILNMLMFQTGLMPEATVCGYSLLDCLI